MNYPPHKNKDKKLPHSICGNFQVNINMESIKIVENISNLI